MSAALAFEQAGGWDQYSKALEEGLSDCDAPEDMLVQQPDRDWKDWLAAEALPFLAGKLTGILGEVEGGDLGKIVGEKVGKEAGDIANRVGQWWGKRAIKDVGYFEIRKERLGTLCIVFDKEQQIAWVSADFEDFPDEMKQKYGWQDEHLAMRVGLEGQPPRLKKADKGYDYQCALRSAPGAKSEQPSEVPPEAATPAWQSDEIRAQVGESTVAVRFGQGWYETPMPVGISQDKLAYMIPVEFHNLGPKTVSPSCQGELKVNTGYIYQASDSCYLAIMDPGKSGSGVLVFRIPPGMTPVELVAKIGQTQVRLKVPAKPIAEAIVKVPANNNSNPYNTRCVKVLRCEMSGFGKNPTLTLEYENGTDAALGIRLYIQYDGGDGKTTGQEDLRGPIPPGRRENLVYKIATSSPQAMICCGVSISGWDGQGLPPALWDKFPGFGNGFADRPVSEWVDSHIYPMIGPISGGAQTQAARPPSAEPAAAPQPSPSRPAAKPDEARVSPAPAERAPVAPPGTETVVPPGGPGFGLPVWDKDLDGKQKWSITQPFGTYYAEMGGFHPGVDWSLPGAKDLGKPVHAVANGIVVKKWHLGDNRGYLVALEHAASAKATYFIPYHGVQKGQEYTYSAEAVEKVYSVYVHIEPAAGLEEGSGVKRGDVVGHITDIRPLSPHLHFEIRNQRAPSSPNWSMVYDAPMSKTTTGGGTSPGAKPSWLKNVEKVLGAINTPQQVTNGTTNWAMVGGTVTGYYLDLQKMVDAGLREPVTFIEANQSKEATSPK
jgi:murein DD-endopeptidase MepM/ murein hydrolase activator NlpD